MGRELLRRVLYVLLRLFTRVEVVGLEHIPQTGGCLLAVNHLSRLDAPLVFAHLRRRDSTGLVANKYRSNWFFRWIVEWAQGIWLDRENPDYGALRAAIRYLRKGGVIGIAPEGTRSPTGGLMRPKAGVAFLAVKANVPIVPVAITGTEKAFRELLRLRRARVRMVFGEPYRLALANGQETAWEAAADEIMCRIASLLPEAYHGVYAGHPRLLELLNMNGHHREWNGE